MIKKAVRFIILFSLGLALAIFTFVLAVNFNVFGHLYTEKEILQFKNENASLILSEEGKILGKIFAENRTNVSFNQLPTHLINALVATEDVRYFEHEGVDSQSLLRVVFKSILLNNKSSGGGSTISQQLAKNMYGRKNFGPLTMPVNKTKEILLARRIEKLYSKEQILTLYLNTVPFGENVYGIDAASRRFFNKKTSRLKVEESAVLIGMLKANTYYNPRIYPEHAKKRRNVVLAQMAKYDYLTEEEKVAFQAAPLEIDYANLQSEGIANYFVARVRREAEDVVELFNEQNGTSYDLRKDGLVIQTTLNAQMQMYALASMERNLRSKQKALRTAHRSGQGKDVLNQLLQKELSKGKLRKRANQQTRIEVFDFSKSYVDTVSVTDSIKLHLTQLHAGIVALDPYTGGVKIWVGGVDYNHFPYDQITAKRQLASSFKPILYAAALEHNFSPCDYLSNEELILTDYDNWSPSNYNHQTGGKYSLQASLAHSKNIPTVNLFFNVGYSMLDYTWQKFGFSSELRNEPAVALGTVNASLLENSKVYAAFANGGALVEPQMIVSIKDADGKVIYQNKVLKLQKTVLSPKSSLYMNQILQKAIKEGTGRSVHATYHLNIDLAGKTGTSQNYADAWFASYTPQLVVLTRVGASSPQIHFYSGKNGSGGRLALPVSVGLWKQINNSSTLRKKYIRQFESIEPKDSADFSCPDFQESNFIEDLFKKTVTSSDKKKKKGDKKRRKKNKKGLFKRIFN